jgi:hypothetical protein
MALKPWGFFYCRSKNNVKAHWDFFPIFWILTSFTILSHRKESNTHRQHTQERNPLRSLAEATLVKLHNTGATDALLQWSEHYNFDENSSFFFFWNLAILPFFKQYQSTEEMVILFWNIQIQRRCTHSTQLYDAERFLPLLMSKSPSKAGTMPFTL